ncbi:patatin-like phospholipase family protein [Romboutsia ilealis]|uniref:Patatin-like phospholipase family protein n=1 Tax=Romboutsia faecis TaxID=2764597 RepID=A0ABR7JSK8_9FIRM|nr:patatin-like phospholipase family protein [Romboutsia faecis]MBC5997892.1 patatin-like phospholipase family protein [Romboutsia faecis]MRN25587.1 patatin-like phospholipase family protein [Romboutsia ilealis]
MLGLALEGGGAKGAFHIGAVKALLENGYKFDGVVGTSIGAFNGALICQGDFEKAYDLWINMEPSMLFDIEDEYMRNIVHNGITKDTIKYISSKTINLIENRGIDTSKMRRVLYDNIDEYKLRASNIDFGMVTVSIPDFNPVEVYKENIPAGKIRDYIMASANFPGFKLYPIDGKYYIDGGIYDNCPVNLLIRKGYNDIIAIRTSKSDKFTNIVNKDTKIRSILASEDLGNALIFDNDLIRRNITLGYFDALRMIKNLKGRKYYIESSDAELFLNILNNIPENVILQMGETLKVPKMDSKRMLFEKIIPTIADLLKLPNTATHEEIFIGLLEVIAEKKSVEKYNIYSINDFIDSIEKTSPIESRDERKRRHLRDLKKLVSELLGSHMLDELAYVVLDTLPIENFKTK